MPDVGSLGALCASGTLPRRVFWLLPHGRDNDPDGPYAKSAPAEAVDPPPIRTATRACGFPPRTETNGSTSSAPRTHGHPAD
ncbi:DUF6009 family protein [Streptomyces malaysiensis]|uniref:DUF6009 family protein n=1 Tax=Streptomyces malaysiensis TaxID=92644 RepID=UPI004048A089